MTDHRALRIETTFSKNFDEPDLLEFRVTLVDQPDKDEDPAPALAKLNGFLVQPGYLPGREDEWYFDIFDMRSGHAVEAFHILAGERRRWEKALELSPDLASCDCVAHLERVWVAQELRGQGIALRLMREAQHVLGRLGLLVILKAHPDGRDVSDAQCRKLARYYQSDRQLGFAPIADRKHPGWLVAAWHEPVAAPGDEVYFSPSAAELTE
jgi:GNAT superfamily N-acetyltransferase